MMLVTDRSSRRNVRLHSSTASSITRAPGAARAMAAARQAEHTAGATEPEYGQALHVRAEAEAIHHARIQRRRRHTGRRYRYQYIDIPRPEAGRDQGCVSRLGQKGHGMIKKQPVALGEVVRQAEPFQRHAGMAPVDVRMVVHGAKCWNPPQAPANIVVAASATAPCSSTWAGTAVASATMRGVTAVAFCKSIVPSRSRARPHDRAPGQLPVPPPAGWQNVRATAGTID